MTTAIVKKKAVKAAVKKSMAPSEAALRRQFYATLKTLDEELSELKISADRTLDRLRALGNR